MLRKAPGPGKARQFEGLHKPGVFERHLDGDFQRENGWKIEWFIVIYSDYKWLYKIAGWWLTYMWLVYG